MNSSPLRVGIGGPVGTGKTALLDRLCKKMRDEFNIAAITNDIYTREDAEFLTRSGALKADRILGVETGGCPHTAIREDASMNLAAVDSYIRVDQSKDWDDGSKYTGQYHNGQKHGKGMYPVCLQLTNVRLSIPSSPTVLSILVHIVCRLFEVS